MLYVVVLVALVDCFWRRNMLNLRVMNRVPFCAAILGGLLLACVPSAYSQPLSFNTLAGYAGQGSADGIGSNARFYNPSGVAVDGVGNVYVADTVNHTIRLITPAGVASTLAGSAGVSGSADGTNSTALFNQPQGVAVDSAGNVYVADTGNQTIRQITPAGVVSTLAGLAGVSGSANGTGSNARFYQPEGVAVDKVGNVYVADTWNHTIRMITPGGVMSTLAGSAGSSGSADATGTAAQFYQPQAVAVDSMGTVYVADTANQTIRKITAGGAVSTLAGFAGNYGSANGTGTNAQFYGPAGVAVDGLGNLYVADYFNQTLRKVTAAGMVSTLAGSTGNFGSADGTNSTVRFWNPTGVAVSGTNTVTVYVADAGNSTIRALILAGTNWVSSTLAGSASMGSTAVLLAGRVGGGQCGHRICRRHTERDDSKGDDCGRSQHAGGVGGQLRRRGWYGHQRAVLWSTGHRGGRRRRGVCGGYGERHDSEDRSRSGHHTGGSGREHWCRRRHGERGKVLRATRPGSGQLGHGVCGRHLESHDPEDHSSGGSEHAGGCAGQLWFQ
jgi:hypothetical protein